MDIEALKIFLEENKQPKFRLSQIIKAVYRDGVLSFAEITNLPKDLRGLLEGKIEILPFKAEKILTSVYKDSIKALLKMRDGNLIETVLISPKPGIWSICISCQVGCPIGCAFCATGKSGFRRNLTAEEITDQVLFWKQYVKKNNIPGKLSNIVYMGMGEPFLNWEEVAKSLKIFKDKNYFNFGSRSISVSTAGVLGGIEKIAEEFLQVNLAISLHFADDAKRSRFMPSNKKFNLKKIKEEISEYFKKSNRKIFLEYILFRDINDGKKDADNLVDFVKSLPKNHLVHVNLIKYNETSPEFIPTSPAQTQKFKNYLLQKKINVTTRKSLGSDIQGACGQLAGLKNN